MGIPESKGWGEAEINDTLTCKPTDSKTAIRGTQPASRPASKQHLRAALRKRKRYAQQKPISSQLPVPVSQMLLTDCSQLHSKASLRWIASIHVAKTAKKQETSQEGKETNHARRVKPQHARTSHSLCRVAQFCSDANRPKA